MTTVPAGPDILRLDDMSPGRTDLVGGKAGNLAAARSAGFAVPDGFCVTTRAYRDTVDAGRVVAELESVDPRDTARLSALAANLRATVAETAMPARLREAITTAYRELGEDVRVAVRSSATAEDLPHASFAGQLDSYLNVSGAEAVIDAVRRCWSSLWTDRAVNYRAANGIGHRGIDVAVLIQVMIDAKVAGVLFTADPMTGNRNRMVVDAAEGLGEAVVSGTVTADHYELNGETEVGRGCLTSEDLAGLRRLGDRLQEHFGSPQDAEWAIDAGARLWLTQSRPITTLFPLPRSRRDGDRVYLSVSAAQGVVQPLTPMGMSVMKMSAAAMWRLAGLKADPDDGPEGFVEAGGRMYADLTAMVRSKRVRKNLLKNLEVQGTRVVAAVEQVLKDPRFSPTGGMPVRMRSILKSLRRFAIPAVYTSTRALWNPQWGHERVRRLARRHEELCTAPRNLTDIQRLRFVSAATGTIMGREMMGMVWVLMAGLAPSAIPKSLLKGVASDAEIDSTLRGMPHNPTTEMDLKLWRLSQELLEHRDLLAHTSPADLAAGYRDGGLPPEVTNRLKDFLDEYGRRAVAEIDVGVPRWAEDPAPVLAIIANYQRVTDPQQAPDRRFARAAAEAESTIDTLVQRARQRHRRLRGRLAGFLLRRARALAGLREVPKFVSLHGFAQIRGQLLEVGASLRQRGLLHDAGDIMYLNIREARAAVEGADHRRLVAERREVHERELRRRQIPVVLLSDGTDPEIEAAANRPAGNGLAGMPAAPGVVTGKARVILEPSGARLEPGEILVAPSTDPGWTPLFLTAGGLVTETGAPNSHGPTVAREYGIPAVISIRSATETIRTGQLITVDGAAGTVVFAGDTAEAVGLR